MSIEEQQIAEQREKMLQQMKFFEGAPTRFLAAWKRGCVLAGPRYFGDGTKEGLEAATDKNQLRPDVEAIKRAVKAKSPGEAIFLAAMVDFYNSHTSKQIQKAAGESDTIDNLTRMDLERRQVIADLLVNYSGW